MLSSTQLWAQGSWGNPNSGNNPSSGNNPNSGNNSNSTGSSNTTITTSTTGSGWFKVGTVCDDLKEKCGEAKRLCIDTLKMGHLSDESAKNACHDNTSKLTRVIHPDFQDCIKAMTSISTANDRSAILFCFKIPDFENLAFLDKEVLSCMGQSVAAASHYYWAYDFLENQSNYSKSKMEEVYQDCKSRPNSAKLAANKKFKIIHRKVLHTSYPAIDYQTHKVIGRLGGLSGMTFVTENLFVTVSDEKSFPALSYFQVNNPAGGALSIDYMGSVLVDSGISDMEDVALDTNGDLIVNSEEIKGHGVGSFLSNFFGGKRDNSAPNSYLFKLTKQGKFLGDLEVSQSLLPQFKKETYECGGQNHNDGWQGGGGNGGNGGGGHINIQGGMQTVVFKGNNDGWDNPPPPMPAPVRKSKPTMCTSSKQTGGFYDNKGIEGIALDSKTRRLFYAPEAPLYDPDFKKEKNQTMPFVEKNLDTNEEKIYSYDIETEHGNGVVAMNYIGGNRLIVLERAYSSQKGEATIRLNLVILPAQSGMKVTKKLLIDFNDLKSQMPVGFRKLDNFEGMSLIPKTGATTSQLILVSDNNFSSSQNTDFLVLEFPTELLKQ
jgi:hypothetical protein